MKASGDIGHDLPERLRAFRLSIGLSQDKAAAKFGIPFSTYKRYESGTNDPSREAIRGMMREGLNANWLLTGKGSMLLADMRASTIAEFEDDYEELGRAFADALGLSKDDLLQARADVTEAMKGIKPDDNNLEGTYPKFLAQLREAYLNVAKSLIKKSQVVRAAQMNLDMPRFLLAIEAVEEGLEAANRTMTPAKKAELFMAVYDMMEEPTNTKERVLKLVKLAA